MVYMLYPVGSGGRNRSIDPWEKSIGIEGHGRRGLKLNLSACRSFRDLPPKNTALAF